MRISSSCTANLERLLLYKSNHFQNQRSFAGGCNYDLKRGICYSENIIYKAIVNSDLEKKFYIGLC